MDKRDDDKKPMTVDEWFKVQLARQPYRGKPDPDKKAEVFDLLATDYLERMGRNDAEAPKDDSKPNGSDE